MEQHSHPSEPVPFERQPSAQSMINLLNGRLDQKAQEIRNLENGDVEKTALLNDLMQENAALSAAMDQIATENRELREKLGIDALGAIEPLTESEDSVH